jgi:predicted acyl esterase
VLRADVFYPVDRTTKKAAGGPCPVILTQTPYGKTISGYLQALAGERLQHDLRDLRLIPAQPCPVRNAVTWAMSK